MRIHFLQPVLLLVLLALPLLWWASVRLRTLSPGRLWTARVLRTVIFLCLALALAQAQCARRSRELTVYYVLDNSDSIPAEQRGEAVEAINETARRMKAADQAGMVVFGGEPSIETNPVKKFEYDGQLRSAVTTRRTNIASGLRLALAAFPPDTMRRIVVLTDGNENDGAALDVARISRNNGIPIDVVPLRYYGRQDLQLSKVVVPQQTAEDAPFDIKVFAEAQRDTEATLRLYENNTVVAEQKVTVLADKKNVFMLPRRLTEGGFHKFRATIEGPDDARPENNTAHAFTFVKSHPKVLYIEGDEMATNYLKPALTAQGVDVELRGVGGIPLTLEQLQSYDSLILSNVEASQMSASQMKMIKSAVHELGIGLIMIGGEKAFGAGGYQDTPIEEALPVSMDIKQKKVLPNGALVVILHTCEIPAGNTWAREISLAALSVLSRKDLFGLLYWGPKLGTTGGGYGGWSENWAWEPGLRECGDKRLMRSAIASVSPSDMPSFDPTLKLAYEGLVKVKAQAKHIIIISDGDPAPPQQNLANAIRDAGISISTVAIAPHSGQTVDTMKALALWGGGTFYYPKSATELPRIFIKEASIVRRSLISEQAFTPEGKHYSEVLREVPGLPPLQGHVVTSIKDLATEALTTAQTDGDPVLAHWRFGLGKTAAFTSDAKNKWAAAWIGSDLYAKFWAQLVRWSMRETSPSNYTMQTDITGGKGTVVIDALDEQGNFRNFLDFEGHVITPDFSTQPLDVRQIAPGRYQASFPAPEVGTYMLSLVSKKDDEMQQLVGGTVLSYSPEYQVSRSNNTLLEALARESGGRLVENVALYNPFLHDLPAGSRPTPLWPALALVALLLLPFDIFVRRVYVDWPAVGKWMRARATAVLGTLRPVRAAGEEGRMSALKDAKARATRAEDEADPEAPAAAAKPKAPAPPREAPSRDQEAAREALRRRLAEQAGGAAAGGTAESPFKPPSVSAAPARHRTKETIVPAEPGGARPTQKPDEFTGSLLEAKKRARKKLK